MQKQYGIIDGNEAAARVAYKLNEVIAIYPITPSSPMGELSDAWAAESRPNLWGSVPSVVEMQSEGGAAGSLHGSLQTGSLSTTFTASQGLLLMIPNMYKIAGELTSAVIHVAARSIAAQALSIFGDHSDVMATRMTGFAMLASDSVQSAHDFALIAQAATLESRIPFIHFFDGFRTSHETSKIELLNDEVLAEMINEKYIHEHRQRGLDPEYPVLRGTAQNPDVYFQARESVNGYYDKCSTIVQKYMDHFYQLTGRKYQLFEYFGAPDAEKMIILMGSGAETVHETVAYLNEKENANVGVLKVRLYRPFSASAFLDSIPKSVKKIAVLDRTKEPGAQVEPLFHDVTQAYWQASQEGKITELPKIVGGRYGLSSKEFSPAMVKSVFENLDAETPKNHFTVGINDDVTNTSLEYDANFSTEAEDVKRCKFYGLGSDGTVGANKNSIKIIGENTENYAQGYFVYDSKKSGSTTISHLRFGAKPIRSTYLISNPNFVGCHQDIFLEQFDVLAGIEPKGVFLLNTRHNKEEIWPELPEAVQKVIIEKKLEFYVIDAYKVAREAGMRNQINTVMQACFFAISGILPQDQAIEQIKKYIEKSYGKKGASIVQKNLVAVDSSLSHLQKVEYSEHITKNGKQVGIILSEKAPEFVQKTLGTILNARGDSLPVSALPIDGTYPTATSQWEKRKIAREVPVWDEKVCIQCGKCSFVCPHGVIRMNVFDKKQVANAPEGFRTALSRIPDFKEKEYQFSLQISTDDCTSCGVCVDICPAKNKSETRFKAINMMAIDEIPGDGMQNWHFFQSIPPVSRNLLNIHQIRQEQLQQPLFEFSGACAGCGETPYVKLVSQLFGDRMVIANATGCSSIYGGNLPTTPWSKNQDGRGPAWSNSLFEDNAEFGFGFRVSLDKQKQAAEELVHSLEPVIGHELAQSLLNNRQKDEADITQQREWVTTLKEILQKVPETSDDYTKVQNLLSLSEKLIDKSVWIIGGDGWGYDIGYGGLDHVLASGKNINVLLLDTEVYSNTGGQMSKSTPRAAIAKFASGGKPVAKKDLGKIAMTYGNIYVGSVAMGARDEHTLRTFLEAEAYDGPSLIIAYSHCIAHGIDMTRGMKQQKLAVETGQWLLYRYNPDNKKQGENPLVLDSKKPITPVARYLETENRFKMLTKSKPEIAKQLFKMAQQDVSDRYENYLSMSTCGQEEDK